MNKLSTNRFLKRRNYFDQSLSINDFVFGGSVSELTVTSTKLLNEIRNLVTALGFNFRLSGFNYLSRLVELYIVNPTFNEFDSIAMIAEYYRVTENNVLANVTETVSENPEFLAAATDFLNIRVTEADCKNITDAVEIIAAIFTIYYNYVVDDSITATAYYDEAINFYRLLKNAN